MLFSIIPYPFLSEIPILDTFIELPLTTIPPPTTLVDTSIPVLILTKVLLIITTSPTSATALTPINALDMILPIKVF